MIASFETIHQIEVTPDRENDMENVSVVEIDETIHEMKNSISESQKLTIAGLHGQAKRMKMGSEKKYPHLEKGKGDSRNLIGMIMEVTTDDCYKIGTSSGVLPQLYSRNQIAACKSNHTEDAPFEQLVVVGQNLEDKVLYAVIVPDNVLMESANVEEKICNNEERLRRLLITGPEVVTYTNCN
nr:unnamed protein product [Callosobruchus analis]